MVTDEQHSLLLLAVGCDEAVPVAAAGVGTAGVAAPVMNCHYCLCLSLDLLLACLLGIGWRNIKIKFPFSEKHFEINSHQHELGLQQCIPQKILYELLGVLRFVTKA